MYDHLLFSSLLNRGEDRAKPTRESYKSEIPQIKPWSLLDGVLVFGGVSIIGIMIGTTIATYVFFGTATLLGLVVVIENNGYLKYLAMRSNKALDMSIFIATIIATASLGITITAALTFAGLGYTLVYSPYLRNEMLRSRVTDCNDDLKD